MATRRQMATISHRRIDDTARAMMVTGVSVTWPQMAQLGDEAGDWLRKRLALPVVETSHAGVTYSPEVRS
mgnify:CR=1 FL=1